MLLDFFFRIRDAGIPVSVKEYLTLLEALRLRVAKESVDDFYFLSRATFVKDEALIKKAENRIILKLKSNFLDIMLGFKNVMHFT